MTHDSICKFCKEPLKDRVIFNNVCKSGAASFIYMEYGESCHFECYIEECVRRMNQPTRNREE